MPLPEGLLAPISEERPGGTEVTYEADYSRVATLRDVRNPEHDFEEVVELATRMLQEESKDLTLAIWLTEAWMNLDGFEGLDSGLRLIHGLLDRFWDGLFPEEAEDRAFTLEFVAEGFTARDDKYEPIKFIPLTDWGHHLHHFEEWRGLRKDSFAGAEDAKKAKKKGDADDNPRAPTPENFESGFAETPKRRYKELRVQLAGCTEAATQLEALSKEHFTDPKGPRPSYGKLKDAISRATTAVQSLLDKKLELEPEPVEAPAGAPADAMEPGGGSPAGAAAAGAEEGGAPPAAPAAVRPAPVGLAPEPTDTEDAHRRVATAARYLRRADPTDPAPYLLLRGLRWGELRRGAGALDVRLLDAPPTEVRKRLKTSVLNAEWEALIEAAEEVMAATWGRGWLDLQRYVLTALDALGSAYRAASDAIKGELAALLRDVPGLLSATLMDDTPTANAETLEWLGLLGLAGEGKGDAAATGGAPDYDRERVLAEATHEKALEWAASGNPMRGVELLKKRAEREESARARFITESLAASVLVNAGMVTVARPMLEDLVDLVTKRNLGDWEAADVVARPVGLLYRCLPANDKRRNQLYDQLCRLDPVLAFSLQGADAGSGAAPATNPPPAKAESANEPAQPAPDGAPVDPGSAGG